MSTTTLLMLLLLATTLVAVTWLSRSPAGRAPMPRPPLPARDATARTAAPVDELRARLRDRYIKARFPGVLNGAADLRDPDQAIRIARHYFDAGKCDRAQELLTLAIGESPADKSLRLARIEIAFLSRDRELFTPLARDLLATRPDDDDWADVARLGRTLAPGETLFGASPATAVASPDNRWPDTPNWIQAPWDFEPAVLATDFHRALERGAASTDTRPDRHAA